MSGEETIDGRDNHYSVERLRNGDVDAITEVYNQYFSRLYSLVFHAVDNNQMATEELVQETFFCAMKNLKQFRGDSKFYTWLCSIAYKKVADYYRKLKREKIFDSIDNTIPEANSLNSPYVTSTQRVVEQIETQYFIKQALSELPFEYRQVLLFKYVEEMSTQEIAMTMSRSKKSIEGLITRARRELRKKIESSGINHNE